MLSISLFVKMKDLLTLTRVVSKALESFQIPGQILKFDIHKGKEGMFEDLTRRTMLISMVATKTINIHNLPGYFSSFLRK